jgi:hypothetical protein
MHFKRRMQITRREIVDLIEHSFSGSSRANGRHYFARDVYGLKIFYTAILKICSVCTLKKL